MPVHRHMGQLIAQIGVTVGEAGNGIGSLGAQTVGVVCILPRLRAAELLHGCQLSAMLPGVFPDEVVLGIADLITGDGSAAVCRQQVAPLGVVIAVLGLGTFPDGFGGVGVHRPGQDITPIVVAPEGSGIGLLIVLPDQLIGRIVGIVVGAVRSRGQRTYPLDLVKPKSHTERPMPPSRTRNG